MNPAMAGLGALTKQNSQPTGRSPESMSQTMALAKQMSDMQLADVLAGKSMNIPQYVAMTEAMGRKQLRTAMQGVTAMGSAKQPTEREKLLSEMMPRQQPQGAAPQGAGLDQLPADNMQGLGHADGGIIAFKERGKVEEPDDYDVNNYQTDQDMGRAMRKRDQSFLGSVGEELGAFGRFIKNPFTSKDPKANYMRELEAQAQRDEESQPRAVMSPPTPVGGRPNNMPLGIPPDMLERLKGQKEQFVETMRGPEPDSNAGSFNVLSPGAIPPSYNPNGVSARQPPSVSPRRMTEAEAAQAEMLRAEAASPMGVAPPNSPAAAPKTGAVPPKTGSGPGAGPNTGGSGTGGGPGGGSTGGSGAGGGGGSLAGTDLSRFAEKQAELLRPKERSKDYYEALTKPTEDIAKQVASGKSQAQGEFLMNIGAALMSTPNIGLALSKGVQAGLPGLAASRKEINALSKDQRDYQFNIAKAKEARDQGDEMLALNYLKLAEESKYHAGMVGAYMARASAAGGANALGPKQYQAAMKNATTAVDAKIAKLGPLEKRKMTDEIRNQMVEAEFTRNISAYQTGTIPATQDPSLELFEKPGGPILTRPQK
jgi:uncharacterized membrane protein YgcG